MLGKQRAWMVKSMNALKPQGPGKVFVAAEKWENSDETQDIALQLGYGVLYENGTDLSVHVE
jgi:hypothetical protein